MKKFLSVTWKISKAVLEFVFIFICIGLVYQLVAELVSRRDNRY